MEKRRAPRHQRNFRVGWRKLGARDSKLEPASVRDLSASGVGLLLPSEFAEGTILIIEISGVPGRFAEPILLRVENTRRQDDAQWLTGCSFTRAFSERETKELLKILAKLRPAPRVELVPEPATPAPEEADPFVTGSREEKRRSVRRKGLSTPVEFFRQGEETAEPGMVVDCSLDGLGIASSLPVATGTFLKVRISSGQESTLSLKVRVRQCRKNDGVWHLGCQFTEQPTSTMLMQFR
jgi:hypothetical protein